MAKWGWQRYDRARLRATLAGILASLFLLAAWPCLANRDSLWPDDQQTSIQINIPAYTLTLLNGSSVVKTYPVAVGRVYSRTPLGEFRIVSKIRYPVWLPPDGSPPVMPGPQNPLGSRWMGLDRPRYGIHSTNAPWSIGLSVSLGCIRMLPAHAEELFELVTVGTKVSIVYERAVVRVHGDEIEVRVYPDIYRLGRPSDDAVRALVTSANVPGSQVEAVADMIIAKLQTDTKHVSSVPLDKVHGQPGTGIIQAAEPERPRIRRVLINGVVLKEDALAATPVSQDGPFEPADLRFDVHNETLKSMLRIETRGEHVYMNDVYLPTQHVSDKRSASLRDMMECAQGKHEYNPATGELRITLRLFDD